MPTINALWLLRLPTSAEGRGSSRSSLAFGVMFGVYQLLLDWQDQLPNWIDPEVSVEFIARWGLLTLLGGIAVGFIGSGIALRRFLRE